MVSLDDARLLTDSLRITVASGEIVTSLSAARVRDWGALLTHADRHSLTPLLASTWRAAGVLDLLPAEARARLLQANADNAARNLNIRQELLEIHSRLTSAGVPHLVLKGWALVERLYADPAERVLYDHDLLVPTGQAQAGHAALRAAGFRPLPAKDEWVEKHLPPLWRNDGYRWGGYLFDPLYPRPVELHVRLWEDGWRGLDVRALPDPWARAVTRSVAGTPLQVLGDADTLIHLAMHFAGHLVEREARLNQLLDLARLVAAAELDWDQVLALAEAARVERFVFASLWLAHAVFAAPPPPDKAWLRLKTRTPAGFRDWLQTRGVADTLTSDYRRKQASQDYRLTFLAAQSLAEKIGIVRFAALPPLGQLQAKYRVRHRWQAALLYPLHIAERALTYGRGLFLHH